MKINRSFTPREIERWRPKTWDQIVGNNRVKNVMRSLYLSHGRGANAAVVGHTGTAKSASVNFTIEMLTCESFSPTAIGPCYKCRNCKQIDCRGGNHANFVNMRNDVGGNELPLLHIYRINASRTSAQEVFGILDDCRYYNDPTLIYVDEAQYLRKFELDERILVDMDLENITWVIATSKPALLDGAFLRRMGGPIPTELPSQEELGMFILDRCTEFQIAYDKPETVSSLVVRSGSLVCEVLRFLVYVAREHQYEFNPETVRSFEFRGYMSNSP